MKRQYFIQNTFEPNGDNYAFSAWAFLHSAPIPKTYSPELGEFVAVVPPFESAPKDQVACPSNPDPLKPGIPRVIQAYHHV